MDDDWSNQGASRIACWDNGDPAPKFYPVLSSSAEFARIGGGSAGSWRGTFGMAQRQIPARQVMANSDRVLHPNSFNHRLGRCRRPRLDNPPETLDCF
jgi:hypothetical protein